MAIYYLVRAFMLVQGHAALIFVSAPGTAQLLLNAQYISKCDRRINLLMQKGLRCRRILQDFVQTIGCKTRTKSKYNTILNEIISRWKLQILS